MTITIYQCEMCGDQSEETAFLHDVTVRAVNCASRQITTEGVVNICRRCLDKYAVKHNETQGFQLTTPAAEAVNLMESGA